MAKIDPQADAPASNGELSSRAGQGRGSSEPMNRREFVALLESLQKHQIEAHRRVRVYSSLALVGSLGSLFFTIAAFIAPAISKGIANADFLVVISLLAASVALIVSIQRALITGRSRSDALTSSLQRSLAVAWREVDSLKEQISSTSEDGQAEQIQPDTSGPGRGDD